jgi:hypothetical protein
MRSRYAGSMLDLASRSAQDIADAEWLTLLALARLEPAPCDRCPKYRYCAAHLAACRTFEAYIEGRGSGAACWHPESRVPMRAIFRECFPDDDLPTQAQPPELARARLKRSAQRVRSPQDSRARSLPAPGLRPQAEAL